MPAISRITVYPIKSLDGHDLPASEVTVSGALAHDRRFALVDSWGNYVNGKNCAAIHRIRATYSTDLQEVTLTWDGQQESFVMGSQKEALAAWCGEVLGVKCRLTENDDGGFPDDCESPGPTLITTTSLAAVASWFEGFDLNEARRRFRFNLEVAAGPAFWEDGLVTQSHKVRRFRVGTLIWQGRGICARCVVPTRDSQDGSISPSFARKFVVRRETSLPDWAVPERFDHYYRLGVNTRLESSDEGNMIRLGDPVELIA